jgi:hypothetical protein
MVAQGLGHARGVAHVGLYQRHIAARDLAQAAQNVAAAVAQVVQQDHVVARSQQHHGRVRADVAGAAR